MVIWRTIMPVDRIKVDKTLQNRLFEKCLFANGVGKMQLFGQHIFCSPITALLITQMIRVDDLLTSSTNVTSDITPELRNQQFIGFNRPSLTAGVPYWKQTLALRTAHQEFSDWSICEYALRGVYAIIKSLRTWYTRIWLFDYISCIILFIKQCVRIKGTNFRTYARCVYQHKQPVLMQSNNWMARIPTKAISSNNQSHTRSRRGIMALCLPSCLRRIANNFIQLECL